MKCGRILEFDLKEGQYALDDKNYTEIKNSLGEVVFKYKSRINEIELVYKNPDGTKSKKKIKEKEIIYWSKKHYEKELHQNKKFIEYLESCKEHLDKLKDKQRKSQEFIEVIDIDKKTGEVIKTKKIVVFLEEKLKKYKETLGFYSIVTSEIEEDDKVRMLSVINDNALSIRFPKAMGRISISDDIGSYQFIKDIKNKK